MSFRPAASNGESRHQTCSSMQPTQCKPTPHDVSSSKTAHRASQRDWPPACGLSDSPVPATASRLYPTSYGRPVRTRSLRTPQPSWTYWSRPRDISSSWTRAGLTPVTSTNCGSVPPGVDRLELSEAVRVAHLRAPQERLVVGLRLAAARTAARAGLAEPGVHAAGVAVPHVDRGVLDRRAPRRVHDRELQVEGRALLALGDVAPDLVEVEVVRPLGHLGSEHARRRRRRRAGRTR